MTTTVPKGSAAIASSQQVSPECCMCGDCGLSYELFRCKICQFRSQHRYCSNLYPKASSYQVCNWCLSHEAKEKSQNSSSSNKNSSEDNSKNSQNKKRNNSNNSSSEGSGGGGGGLKTTHHHEQLQVTTNNIPIKKQRSPETERLSPQTTRRRLISTGRLEEMKLIRRSKSEEISNINNNGITRHVFRNKVRRYKLLDEVSS